MITVQHHVGRLVEVVLITPITVEEVPPLFAQIIGFIKKVGAGCVVTDLRNCGLFGPDVGDSLINHMKGSNDSPAFIRMAFLTGPSSVHVMQVTRLTKAAGSDKRRWFTKYPELRAFMGEVLTPEELARLDAFYAESAPEPS